MTGLQHAGEVSSTLSRQRQTSKPLVRISDAASKNFAVPKSANFIDACCNEHAFAYFRNARENHPESYEFVAGVYGEIYENERHCKDQKLASKERLAYHQKFSLSHMIRLRDWASEKLKFTEDNSDEGTAVNYLANHFVKLTEFLRTPGVPLDTNRVEQFLRVSKRYFRNSSFYLTDTGAEVGDIMMSLIRTAVDAGISPVDYLEWCLENFEDLSVNPQNYFPWAYPRSTAKSA